MAWRLAAGEQITAISRDRASGEGSRIGAGQGTCRVPRIGQLRQKRHNRSSQAIHRSPHDKLTMRAIAWLPALYALAMAPMPSTAQGTGGSSGNPTITLDARDSELIEERSARAKVIFCQEKDKGKSDAEALSEAIKKTPYIDGLPKKLQSKMLADALADGKNLCGSKTSAGPSGNCQMEINGWRPRTCNGGPNLQVWKNQ